MPSSTVNAIHWDNQTMLSVQGTGEMRSSISNFKVKKKLIIRAHFICRKSIFNQSHRKIISSLSWNSFRYFSETFSFISVSIGESLKALSDFGPFTVGACYRWSQETWKRLEHWRERLSRSSLSKELALELQQNGLCKQKRASHCDNHAVQIVNQIAFGSDCYQTNAEM